MAIGRVYDVSPAIGTGILIGSTNPGNEYPLLVGTTTIEYNISAIRVGMISGSSASYPANGTITFRLRRPANAVTFTAGVQAATGTAYPVGQSTTPSSSVWTYSTLANATGTCSALGNVVWEQTLPLTAGATGVNGSPPASRSTRILRWLRCCSLTRRAPTPSAPQRTWAST